MMSLKTNPHIRLDKEDYLYHLNLGTKETDIKQVFHDVKQLISGSYTRTVFCDISKAFDRVWHVKFVCLGGTQSRMYDFAQYLSQELHISGELNNYTQSHDRYSMYKVGPVLCANHGIGVPSLSIVLNELFKLLFYAECKDVLFIRIGTCGGIGIEPGTVVISNKVVNGELKPIFNTTKFGKKVKYPVNVDPEVVDELYKIATQNNSDKIAMGTTMSVDCFYEGQGRLDGAVCDYTNDDKMVFLHQIAKDGVKNIEMESLGLFAFCHRAGFKALMVAVAIVNRLESDNPADNIKQLQFWEHQPFHLISRFIQNRLKSTS